MEAEHWQSTVVLVKYGSSKHFNAVIEGIIGLW